MLVVDEDPSLSKNAALSVLMKGEGSLAGATRSDLSSMWNVLFNTGNESLAPNGGDRELRGLTRPILSCEGVGGTLTHPLSGICTQGGVVLADRVTVM